MGGTLNQGLLMTIEEGRDHLFPPQKMTAMTKVCWTEDQSGSIIVTFSCSLVLLFIPSANIILSIHCIGLDKVFSLTNTPQHLIGKFSRYFNTLPTTYLVSTLVANNLSLHYLIKKNEHMKIIIS